MSLFAVTYTYTDDAAALDRHRPDHRGFLGALADRGTLRAAGPFSDDAGAGALLLIRADGAEEVRTILAGDPFAAADLIVDTAVREWNVVLGANRDDLTG
ncbi:YciI family protein [Propionibacteriaceae bacterium Y2011]